mmetsp:Transcript_21052/g.65243  ORF Transcript_21052/g.65243 Transcript_21052/m.65243 type:complete len:388 (-) Transcript_21052:292-1455(-)
MESEPRPHAARATAPLLGSRARAGHIIKAGDARFRVVALLLQAARVDHEGHVVDGNRRLGNVGGQYDLAAARRRPLEGAPLLVWRQAAVQLDDPVALRHCAKPAYAREEHLIRRLDLLRARQENQDGARRRVPTTGLRVFCRLLRCLGGLSRHLWQLVRRLVADAVPIVALAVALYLHPGMRQVDAFVRYAREAALGTATCLPHRVMRRTARLQRVAVPPQPVDQLGNQGEVDGIVVQIGKRARNARRIARLKQFPLVHVTLHAALGVAHLACTLPLLGRRLRAAAPILARIDAVLRNRQRVLEEHGLHGEGAARHVDARAVKFGEVRLQRRRIERGRHTAHAQPPLGLRWWRGLLSAQQLAQRHEQKVRLERALVRLVHQHVRDAR